MDKVNETMPGLAGQGHHAWRSAGIWLLVLIVLVLAVYHETAIYLAALWSDLSGSYGHGFMVLGISLYLVYRSRHALARQIPEPYMPALAGVVCISVIWLLAVLADVRSVQIICLYLVIVAIVWLVLGSRIFRQLLLPFLLLAFAFPVWEPLQPPLQVLATDVVYWLARLLGVPVLREDNLLSIPAGKIFIEQGCSGLNYLLAALSLGIFYAVLTYQKSLHRWLVIAIAAGAAIIANILRVFIVVYVAYESDMQSPLVNDHLTLGWFLFGGLIMLLLVIDGFINAGRQPENTGDTENGAPVYPDTEAAVAPGKYRLASLSALSIIVLSAASVHWINARQAQAPQFAAIDLPGGMGGWEGPLYAPEDWMPDYSGATETKKVYRKAGEEVQVYIGYYSTQSQGRELINDMNRISGGENWQSGPPRSLQINSQPVLEQLLENKSHNKLLVWHWYVVAGRIVTDPYRAKVLQVLGKMTGRPQAAVLAVATASSEQADAARDRLSRFVTVMQQPLNNLQELVGDH